MHVIRLLGPWRIVSDVGGSSRTVKLPLDSSQESTGGRVQLQRRFQRPTNLDPEERVLLMLPPGLRPTAVQLGDVLIATSRRLGNRPVWNLTEVLQRSNLLTLHLDGGEWAAALQHPVLLGIQPDAGGHWWESLPEVE
jgi:hypothetical protein